MASIQGEIIQGDNRDVLDRLIAEKITIKCGYIDPPYNNFDRLTHYKDGLPIHEWLEMVGDVSSKIFKMLEKDGSLWISIDDRNVHNLRCHLDQVIGSSSYAGTIIWQHRTSRENRAVFSNNHEYILVYAKELATFKKARNHLGYSPEWLSRFKNPDSDPRGPWQSVSLTAQGGHATASQYYSFQLPSGRLMSPPKGRCWAYSAERMRELVDAGFIYFGKTGDGVPRLKKYLCDAQGGLTPHTLWTAEEVGTTASAKKHLLSILEDENVFETPKPEGLIERVLSIASNPGDLVLDAYLGSGTTASVAHKMDRRYIGIEIGDHIASHCAARLRSVCAGEGGGISEKIGWKGGGSFVMKKANAA